MILYNDFLNQVIDRGIVAANRDYRDVQKRQGSIAGFEACRNKQPHELLLVLAAAKERREAAHQYTKVKYWYYRCAEAEIEWVCNCVSVVLVNEGKVPLVTPTARAATLVAQIIGVKEHA